MEQQQINTAIGAVSAAAEAPTDVCSDEQADVNHTPQRCNLVEKDQSTLSGENRGLRASYRYAESHLTTSVSPERQEQQLSALSKAAHSGLDHQLLPNTKSVEFKANRALAQVQSKALNELGEQPTPTATDFMTDTNVSGNSEVSGCEPSLARRKRGRPRKEELLARKRQSGAELVNTEHPDGHVRWRASMSSIDIPRTVHIMYDYPKPKGCHEVNLDKVRDAQSIAAKALASLSRRSVPEPRAPRITLSEPHPTSAAVRVLRMPRRTADGLSGPSKTSHTDGIHSELAPHETASLNEEPVSSDQVTELVSNRVAKPSNLFEKGA
jgi:hypothetical protein